MKAFIPKTVLFFLTSLVAGAWVWSQEPIKTPIPTPAEKPKILQESPAQPCKYKLGQYDPRVFMPLEVGNSWTYEWKSDLKGKLRDFLDNLSGTPMLFYMRLDLIRPSENKGVVSDESSGQASKPTAEDKMNIGLYQTLNFYSAGGENSVIHILNHYYRPENHRETYRIVRKDDCHFYFVVDSEPKMTDSLMDSSLMPRDTKLSALSSALRDGRYGGSIENCWTWWSNDYGAGLTESISVQPSTERVGNSIWADLERIPKGTLPSNHRISLYIEGCEKETREAEEKYGQQILQMHELRKDTAFVYANIPITFSYKTTLTYKITVSAA